MKFSKNSIYLLVILSGFFFFSCKQKGNGPSVFGQWKVTFFDFDSTSSIYKEMSVEKRHDMKAIATGFAFDFKKDNTFIITHRDEKNAEGTFKITGKDEILMTPEGDTTQPNQILLLDKETLIMKDIKRGYIFTLKKI